MTIAAIEKSVPLPDTVGGGLAKKYPWRSMSVGDSFLFPSTASVASAASQASTAGRSIGNGVKFTISTKTDPGRIRCWRIA